MEVDLSALRKNEFWRKKFRRAVMVRDTTKDGCISRTDFEVLIDRCKKLNIAPPSYIERFVLFVRKICESVGLVDKSVKLSYDEFEDKWFAARMKQTDSTDNFGGPLFDVLDIDEDGFISFEEWTALYKIIGIDTAHARASFDAIDTDRDQKICKDEFVKYYREYSLSTENKLNSAILYGPLE